MPTEPTSTGVADTEQPSDSTYDAFISYRRAQAWPVASWLSDKLVRYRPSGALLAQLPQKLRERLGEPRRVFLDKRYERGNRDFWDAHIVPALISSRRLIVISTADAFEPRGDGSPNWVEREIETYWEQYRDPDRIMVALASGAPEDRHPGRLCEISERWDWADLRGYGPFYWLFPRRAGRLEAAFIKLLAGMYDIPAEFVPFLRREEERRRNRWRSAAAALLIAGIGLSSFGAWQWYERSQQAVQTEASSIWSRLEFASDLKLARHEVEALWALATAEAATRRAFLKQLAHDRTLVIRFARQPEPVLRALGLRLAIEQVDILFSSVFIAIANTTNPYERKSLVGAVVLLSARITPDEAQVLADRILPAFRVTNDAIKLELLAEAVAAFPRLTSEQAQAALDPILTALKLTTNRYALQSLANAIAVLPVQLTPEQAQTALDPILAALINTTESILLRSLAEAVAALAPRLTPEQAEGALASVLAALERTTGRTPGIADIDEEQALAGAVAALAPRLTPEQAEAALNPILAVSRSTTHLDKLQSLAKAMQALALRLSAERARTFLEYSFIAARKEKTTDLYTLRAMIELQAALVPRFSAEQEERAALLASLLSGLETTTDPGVLRALARVLTALAPQLNPEQAETALDRALASLKSATLSALLRGTTNFEAIGSLALAVSALAPRLTSEQAQAALNGLLAALKSTTDDIARLSVASAMTALAPRLTSEQAQAALDPIFTALRSAKPGVQRRLAKAVMALPLRLTPEQAKAALDPILAALKDTIDSDDVWPLASMTAALAPQLPNKTDMLRRLARSGLGAAVSGTEARAWADVHLLLLPNPDNDYISELVEMLKYPTAALRNAGMSMGEPANPTAHLLSKLQERFPGVPELRTGSLDDALAWVAKTYPAIDLARLPTRPQPLRDAIAALLAP